MQIRLTIRDAAGVDHDVLVAAPSSATVADLLAALPDSLVPRALWIGGDRLAESLTLDSAGLLDATIVTVVPSASVQDRARVLQVEVVAGPSAGRVAPLVRRVVTVGRGAECDLVLDDPACSRQHAVIAAGPTGLTVRDTGSTHGTTLDGEPVGGVFVSLSPGQLIEVGDSRLSITGVDTAAAAFRPAEDGRLLVNRPPRSPSDVFKGEVYTEPPARPRVSSRMQISAALVPAAFGVCLAIWMHNPQYLAFALMSPIMLLTSASSEGWRSHRERRKSASRAVLQQDELRREIAQLLVVETADRRTRDPDPAALARIIRRPGSRLWERRNDDTDALTVRLGTADMPARTVVRSGSDATSAGTIATAPVVVDLRAGPLGVCGPADLTAGTTRWLVCQLAGLHSPADLAIALILSDRAAQRWTWARWLPHLRGRIATTQAARQELVNDLVDHAERTAADRTEQRRPPWTLLIIDSCADIGDLPGISRLLGLGPTARITAVCVSQLAADLPSACNEVAQVAGERGARLALSSGHVIADRVSMSWADGVARALCPLLDAGVESPDPIPDRVRLLDLLGLDGVDPHDVMARWSRRHGGLSTPIGLGADGIVEIDLIRDGPHALVAGTTGSGKSELLQSLVAGLACSYPPTALSFVLIDYKGGAAFAECADLPHTVGLVTDLDPHLTQRALQSLDAELRLRESLFARAGVPDIGAYGSTRLNLTSPLGRLVIVVDEFAALAEELPTFVCGLVGVAQRGRSLGVHLVLATQRPGPSLSPEIRANTTLRIALRMTDGSESSNVIGVDSAAMLDKTKPGSALIRAGAALTRIHTALVSSPAPVSNTMISVSPLDSWARPYPQASDTHDKTDLHMLADAMRELVAAGGPSRPRRPWLPPMPSTVALTSIAGPALDGSALRLGLFDLPSEQRQDAYEIDLAAGGSWLITGAARTGRTTAVRTLAAAAADQLSADDLHIYALDFGGGGLQCLTALPHCGAVASRHDFDIAARLVERLAVESARRMTNSVRPRPAPSVLLIIDGWEAFARSSDDHESGRSVDLVLSLARDAASAGFTVAITGDRATLSSRVAGVIGRRIVLRLSDSADYAMAGLSVRDIPAYFAPGRGLTAPEGIEVQLAHLGADPSSAEQERAVRAVAHRRLLPTRRPPLRLMPLPRLVRRIDLPAGVPPRVVLGVGGDLASAVHLDPFAAGGAFLVCGPARSGRTTVLASLACQSRSAELIFVAPRRSPLLELTSSLGAIVIGPSDQPDQLHTPYDGSRLILVDDSEAFLDTAVGDALAALARTDQDGLATAVVARSDDLALTYRGVAHEVRRHRRGLLLQPRQADGDLLGIRMPRTSATPPGRGVLVSDELGDQGDGPFWIQVAQS